MCPVHYFHKLSNVFCHGNFNSSYDKYTCYKSSAGKSPGEDGSTVKFYSTFFDLIGDDLIDCLNYAYENEQFNQSHSVEV